MDDGGWNWVWSLRYGYNSTWPQRLGSRRANQYLE